MQIKLININKKIVKQKLLIIILLFLLMIACPKTTFASGLLDNIDYDISPLEAIKSGVIKTKGDMELFQEMKKESPLRKLDLENSSTINAIEQGIVRTQGELEEFLIVRDRETEINLEKGHISKNKRRS